MFFKEMPGCAERKRKALRLNKKLSALSQPEDGGLPNWAMQSHLIYLTSLWFFRQWWVTECKKEKASLNMIHVLSSEWKVETQSLMPALQESKGFCCFDPVILQQSYPSPAQCIPLLPDASPSGRADLLLWTRLPRQPWVLCKLQKTFTCKSRAPPEILHSCLLCHTVQWNTSKDCQHNIAKFYAMYLQAIMFAIYFHGFVAQYVSIWMILKTSGGF